MPDAFIIIHTRATDRCYFGPFATLDEAREWNAANPAVRGVVAGVYKTVDWSRSGYWNF